MLKINPKLKIIIYQHFSLAVWDKEIYENELQSSYKVFIKEFKNTLTKGYLLLILENLSKRILIHGIDI